jgi:hypothetical protein
MKFFKKAFWWRLYYFYFTDFFEGMALKEVLFGEYGAEEKREGDD